MKIWMSLWIIAMLIIAGYAGTKLDGEIERCNQHYQEQLQFCTCSMGPTYEDLEFPNLNYSPGVQ